MSRRGTGHLKGMGAAQQRIVAVLRALGTEKDGRPKSIRAAELAARAEVDHASLSSTVKPLLELGHITRCMVQPSKGPQTYEYRAGMGVPAPAFSPLDTRRAGMALGKPGKPLPVTTKAPALSTPKPAAADTPVPSLRAAATAKAQAAPGDDVGVLERVQRMTETEFTDYLRHLARVWIWARAQQLATDALANP